MQYQTIPGVTKPVSRIVQGGIMLRANDKANGFALLDAVYAAGINTIDTAHVYANGDCERTLGRWIDARGLRDHIVILDKGAHHNHDRRRVTPFDITADLYDSLARLQTDYIDLYVLHRDDPDVPVEPIVDVLNEHRNAGMIQAFGASNWTAERVAAANRYAAQAGLAGFVVSSPQYSLAEQVEPPWPGCTTITGDAHADERAWYRDTGMAVCCWSSLAHGLFSGRVTAESPSDGVDDVCMRCYASPANFQRLERAQQLARERGLTAAQLALAYVLDEGERFFPIVAAYSAEEADANIAALDVTLTPEERAWLDLRRDTPA